MNRSFLEEIFGLALHFMLATAGIILICLVVGFCEFLFSEKTGLSLGAGSSFFGTAYSPWFWIPAGLGGYFVNRSTRNCSACVVGLIAVLLLSVLLFRDVSSNRRSPYYSHLINEQYHGQYWQYEFEQLLSPSDANCGSSECLGKLFFTLPVVTSIAYSIGAWVGLRSKRTNLDPERASIV
jgi:hypothetical protein